MIFNSNFFCILSNVTFNEQLRIFRQLFLLRLLQFRSLHQVFRKLAFLTHIQTPKADLMLRHGWPIDEAIMERWRVLASVKILALQKIPAQHIISALWTMAVPQMISALQMIAEPPTTAVPQMTPDPRIILVSRMVPAPAMKILFVPPPSPPPHPLSRSGSRKKYQWHGERMLEFALFQLDNKYFAWNRILLWIKTCVWYQIPCYNKLC